jgi:pyruvate ferredoxin oxidoreductase alpha subunit
MGGEKMSVTSVKSKKIPLTGAEAVAEAMKQIKPDVVAAYPITPQTPIVEIFSKFAADGLVDTEVVTPESEHSAISIVTAASASGTRAMSASASQGLALMVEVLPATSGLRLPVVMAIANRALSAPINIHCDHSDMMAVRDLGWIEIFSENAQEAYENMFLAVKLSEHPDVLLPSMVGLDGFIISHGVEVVEIFDDEVMYNFVGQRKPHISLFDFENPITIGPLQLTDYYFETKKQEQEAMKNALKLYLEVGKELSKITGKDYPYFEKYYLDDAEVAIVVMSSTAGTAKDVVDDLRKEGKKVGLLKPKLYRPFPYDEYRETLKNLKAIGVLDRAYSFGANAPLYSDVRNALYDLDKKIPIQSYIFGLGGRDIFKQQIKDVFIELLSGKISKEEKCIGLRE